MRKWKRLRFATLRIARLWRRLLLSPGAEVDRMESLQTRQLSAVLLITFLVGTVAVVAYLVETWDYFEETLVDHLISLGSLAALPTLFFLNRGGRFRLSATLTVAVIFVAIYASAVPTGSLSEVTMLGYLVIPVVASGLFLSVGVTAVVALASVMAVMTFPYLFPVPPGLVPAANVVLISGFVLVAAFGRRRVEADRRRRLENTSDRLRRLATHDHLTGLANRLLFDDRLQHALERHRRTNEVLALIYLDLDNFKEINDALSHAAGDEVLAEVSRRIRRSLRTTDTVARLGGDEFGILLEGLHDPYDIQRAVVAITTSMGAGISVRSGEGGEDMDREVYVTASLGICSCPVDGTEARELHRKADTALYSTKASGKAGYAYYTPEMSRQTVDSLRIASDLRHAINRDELFVLYQPQVDATTGSAVAFECLLRWNHPEEGLIPPGRFIPVAEESGLILELTEFVLRHACIAAAETRRLFPDRNLRFSANISGRDLRSPDFVDALRRLLKNFSAPTGLVELELTENIVFHQLQSARRGLMDIKDMGVRIAVDDFGSGYATLRQVSEFPVDALKIDRAFAAGVAKGSTDHAAVAGVMEMARRLGVEVIAEGVETAEERAAYRSLGCRLMQGWVFSKAVGWDEVLSLCAPGVFGDASST